MLQPLSVAKPSAGVEEITSKVNQFSSTKVALILDKLIFHTLLILFALIAIPYGAVEPWWEMIFECSVFALGVLWTIERLLTRGPGFRTEGLLIPVLFLVGYAFIQMQPFWRSSLPGMTANALRSLSSDPYETKRFAFRLIALAMTGLLLLNHLSSLRRLRLLVHVIIGIGVGSAIFGIARQAMQHDNGFFLPHLVPGGGYGQFINADHFAFLMEMALGLVIGLLVGGGVSRARLPLYLSMAILMWVATILSTSRAGIGSLLGQVFFFALTYSYARPRQEVSESKSAPSNWKTKGHLLLLRLSLIACLMIGLVVGIVWIGGKPLATRLEYTATEFGSDEVDKYKNIRRVKIWEATWQMIKDNPVAGVGFGGYWVGISKYHNGSGQYTPQQAHNDYLEWVASGGLIGLALGLWFVVSFISRLRERFRSTDPIYRAIRLGALAGIFAVAIHSSVDFGLHITINAVMFTCLIIIAILDERLVST